MKVPVSFFATCFTKALPYNEPCERGEACDGGLYRQRVCPEYADGLSADPRDRTPGRCFPSAEAVLSGGPAGRCLRRFRVFAALRVSCRVAGKTCGWDFALCNFLRRGEKAAAADAAAVWRLLRICRLCSGAWPVGRRRRPNGQRYLLYGRGRQDPADRRRRGLSCNVRGIPGRRAARGAGDFGSRKDRFGSAERIADSPVRYRKRPAGPGDRAAAFGSVRCAFGVPVAAGNAGAADYRAGPAVAGRRAGAVEPGKNQVPAGSVQRGWDFQRLAVGIPQRLGGDREKTL